MSMKRVEDVFLTKDYGIFKRLGGNRDVNSKRVGIIVKSISEIGYISNPIIVNEKFEIIDGQGRLEACRQLRLPVEYRIIPGLGIEECRYMNLKPTAWTIADYCKSYAELGNKNYSRLLDIHDTYGISIPDIVIGMLQVKKTALQDRWNYSEKLKTGELVLSEETYWDMLKFLDMYVDAIPSLKKIGGRQRCPLGAFWWLWNYGGDVDFDRLKKQIKAHGNLMYKFVGFKETLKDFSAVYNRGLTAKNRVHWDIDYADGKKEENA